MTNKLLLTRDEAEFLWDLLMEDTSIPLRVNMAVEIAAVFGFDHDAAAAEIVSEGTSWEEQGKRCCETCKWMRQPTCVPEGDPEEMWICTNPNIPRRSYVGASSYQFCVDARSSPQCGHGELWEAIGEERGP